VLLINPISASRVFPNFLDPIVLQTLNLGNESTNLVQIPGKQLVRCASPEKGMSEHRIRISLNFGSI
jgi:hypothetical protein